MKNYFILIASSLILFGCSFGEPIPDPSAKPEVIECARPRIQASLDFHSKAKDLLASYYKTRKEYELFFAWYATEDSNYKARAIGKCFDKRNKHYHAVRNINKKNNILKKLIVQNMRTEDQSHVSELFLEDYQKIFVRDIQ